MMSATLPRMSTRLLPILAAALLLSACGNKADLLQPRQVPPEDRNRYLFTSSIPPRAQLDAEEEAAWAAEDAAADAAEAAAAAEEAGDARDGDDAGAASGVPLILDVPAPDDTP